MCFLLQSSFTYFLHGMTPNDNRQLRLLGIKECIEIQIYRILEMDFRNLLLPRTGTRDMGRPQVCLFCTGAHLL